MYVVLVKYDFMDITRTIIYNAKFQFFSGVELPTFIWMMRFHALIYILQYVLNNFHF